jgi:hypothetical protein
LRAATPLVALLGLYLAYLTLRAWWETPRSGLRSIRCYFRGHHNPVRHPLGGFKCADCGEAGADLSKMGFTDGGYVSGVRRVFQRTDGGTTRTTAFTPGPKGW